MTVPAAAASAGATSKKKQRPDKGAALNPGDQHLKLGHRLGETAGQEGRVILCDRHAAQHLSVFLADFVLLAGQHTG